MKEKLYLSLTTNKTLAGKILRLPLKLIPQTMNMPILTGPLRGKKWTVGSGNHSCWLGTYEYDKQKKFCKYINKKNIVFDLGANVGFYSLLASVLVGSEGKVYAFEPLKENIDYLKQHIQQNNINNVNILESAVSDSNGYLMFTNGGGAIYWSFG